MSSTIEYVYCVIPASVFPTDVDQGAPRGIDGGEVRRIVFGELAALVSSLDAATYAGDTVAERAGDAEWLAPRAVTHDAVVTWASDIGPVAPLPMWVMFGDSEGVASMLGARAPVLQDGLDFVAGAREYAVRVVADRHALAEAAVSLDPALAAVEQQAQTAPPGQAYLLRRKLAAAQKDTARDIAGRIGNEIHSVLSAKARASALRAPSGGSTGDQPNLILDGAYLVPEDQYDEFRLALTQIIERYGTSGCRFEFTGPWPPYHFVRGNK
ncbi:MAG: GvpL/GvpF family gas vesicle protein [Gemmatimonadaceae bacterium]